MSDLEAQIGRVREIHSDAGRSQGYLSTGGYGYIDNCCAECGTPGEYGVPYPCRTIQALDEVTA